MTRGQAGESQAGSVWRWVASAIVLGAILGLLAGGMSVRIHLRAPGHDARALLERTGWSLPQAVLLAQRAHELRALPSFREQPEAALESYTVALAEAQGAMRRAGACLPDIPALAAAADAREAGVPIEEIEAILSSAPRGARAQRLTEAFFAHTASVGRPGDGRAPAR